MLNITFQQLHKRINFNPKGCFIYLVRQVNSEFSNYIYKLQLPKVYLREELRRYYSAGHVTSHFIGVIGIDKQDIESLEKSVLINS